MNGQLKITFQQNNGEYGGNPLLAKMDTIGWIGSILLAFCGLPQAIEAYKTKQAKGITWGFIITWFTGELLTLVYIIPKMELPLLFNYSANILFLSVIMYYKIKPDRLRYQNYSKPGRLEETLKFSQVLQTY